MCFNYVCVKLRLSGRPAKKISNVMKSPKITQFPSSIGKKRVQKVLNRNQKFQSSMSVRSSSYLDTKTIPKYKIVCRFIKKRLLKMDMNVELLYVERANLPFICIYFISYKNFLKDNFDSRSSNAHLEFGLVILMNCWSSVSHFFCGQIALLM